MRLIRFILLSIALAITVGGCGGSSSAKSEPTQRGMTKDIGGVVEEKEFKESELALPPYPQESARVEYRLRQNSENRYYVDRSSISIGPDRVVRYSSIVKSPFGALSVSYEGMRCKTSEYKVYAFGVTSGEWTQSRDAQWRRIPRMASDLRFTLYKDYFCDLEAIAGRNEKDLIANLVGNPLNNVTDKNR